MAKIVTINQCIQQPTKIIIQDNNKKNAKSFSSVIIGKLTVTFTHIETQLCRESKAQKIKSLKLKILVTNCGEFDGLFSPQLGEIYDRESLSINIVFRTTRFVDSFAVLVMMMGFA